MDFLLNNLGTITLVLGVVYPPALFLLPASTASKISVGIKIVKKVASALETAQNTKGGFSTIKNEQSSYYQKSKV